MLDAFLWHKTTQTLKRLNPAHMLAVFFAAFVWISAHYNPCRSVEGVKSWLCMCILCTTQTNRDPPPWLKKNATLEFTMSAFIPPHHCLWCLRRAKGGFNSPQQWGSRLNRSYRFNRGFSRMCLCRLSQTHVTACESQFEMDTGVIVVLCGTTRGGNVCWVENHCCSSLHTLPLLRGVDTPRGD